MPTQDERRATTRSALLAAAAELVVEAGTGGVTLAAVGARAGYSRGIVTHHFGSRQALLDALARASQSGYVPGLKELDPGLERLLRLVEGYVRELGRNGTAARAFLVLWAEAATAPSPLFRERDEAFRADLRAEVEAGIAAGTIRPETDPAAVAVAVLGQLRGIALQRLVDPAAVDTARTGPRLAEYWQRALAPS